MEKSFDQTWEYIYAAGRQLNKYPYDEIVSFVFRYADRTKAKKDIAILEIGCGAGNNLWFAAREGFSVTGIDASQSAIEYARMRFQNENLSGNFEIGDFTKLPLEDHSFDMVIDRAAMTHTSEQGAQKTVAEVRRVLKPGGLFFSQVFGDDAGLEGEQAAGDVRVGVKGAYADVGQVRLYNESKIKALFREEDWLYSEWFKIVKTSLLDQARFVTWQLVLKKK